jgi:hypothetical protein
MLPGFNDARDEKGVYIRKYYSNPESDLITIYSRCQNLTNIVIY